MKVVYCGGLNWDLMAPDHLGIKQGMSMLGWDWHVVDPITGDLPGPVLAEQINSIDPQLVIHGNTDSLTKNICSDVKPHIKQVFWMLDYRTPSMLEQHTWYGWQQSAPYLDTIFISAEDHIELWQEAFNTRTFYAPHACWIPPEGLQMDGKFAHPILFIGVRHHHPPFSARTELLADIDKALEAQGTTYRIKYVNGDGWKERQQVWTDMPKYYHSARTVLDVSHFWDSPGYSSGRYWYTTTLGAVSITKRFPKCEQLFPEGVKLYFDTPEQAASLLEVYTMLHPQGRLEFKQAAAKYAWKNHNYKIRFEQMLQCIETGKQAEIYAA